MFMMLTKLNNVYVNIHLIYVEFLVLTKGKLLYNNYVNNKTVQTKKINHISWDESSTLG